MTKAKMKRSNGAAKASDDSEATRQDSMDFDVRGAFAALGKQMMSAKAVQQGIGLGVEWLRILSGTSEIDFDKRDRRFRDSAWQNNALYKRLGQSYLAFCQALEGLVDPDDENWRNRERIQFAISAFTSTLAPTNFLLGNPAALSRTLNTGGANLLKGASSFIRDMQHNGGLPSQVDASGFTVGKNLAATKGAVVFRNDVLEVLQYFPLTSNVYETPVLMITPQINKYYFLDLAPDRSFIEYLVSQGQQPFVVSWKNPGAAQAHWNLDSYCEALLEALAAVREISRSDRVNTFGFCAGGITMTALLGYMAQKGDDQVNAISYAVTLLDLAQPAMVGMLQSKPLIRTIQSRSRDKGIIAGKDLAALFAWFRPNDLIWNYWVNNYLLGESPPSFDILAWNADSTNLPAGLHSDFLDIFADNSLTVPGERTVLGTTVDLGTITNDAFVTGAKNDHLTPWHGCYQTTQLLGGNSEFVLSNGGHIASLVNPVGNPKASYQAGTNPGPDSAAWQADTISHQGSWWEHWVAWAGERSGSKRKARKTLGSKKHPPLADAPGTYVLR